ncbi:hypothetical protein ACFVH6_01835 [Spirillospora sp. NPDC127200]
MRTPSRIALSLLGSTALLVAGTTPAHAIAGYFRDETTALMYSGGVQGTGLGNSTLSTPHFFGVQHFCGTAQFSAAISGAHAWSFTSFSMNCTNDKGGTTTLSALSTISTTGGQYSPVSGGRDGLLSVSTPVPGLTVRVVMSLPALAIYGLVCDYGLTTTIPLVFDWFDRSNPYRPVPANAHAQLALTEQSFQRLRFDSRCSAVLRLTARYQVLAHPGGQDLRMTP